MTTEAGAVPTTAVHVLHTMGMTFSIHLRGPASGTTRARTLVERVRRDLVRADEVFSTYRADSDVSRIDAGLLSVADADPTVREVLRLAERARERTGGRFSVHLTDRDGRTRFDPSGLVKGWAAQRAFATLMSTGDLDVCLNAGGDVVVGTRTPGRVWRVAVEDPATGGVLGVVPLRSGALATSGTAARGEHILDPSTGAFPSALRQVSVTGPTLLWADVLATAAFVAGDSALDLMAAHPGYQATVITVDGRVRSTAAMAWEAVTDHGEGQPSEGAGGRSDTRQQGSAGSAAPPCPPPSAPMCSALDGEEPAQGAGARDGHLALRSHVGGRRDQHALLVDPDLARCRVLHDPAPPVRDVPRLPAHRRRGAVADDVAGAALQGAELVEGEPDHELTHQGPGAPSLMREAEPGAGLDMPDLSEVTCVEVLHTDEPAVPPHGQRQAPVVRRELGPLRPPPRQRGRGEPVGRPGEERLEVPVPQEGHGLVRGLDTALDEGHELRQVVVTKDPQLDVAADDAQPERREDVLEREHARFSPCEDVW